MSTDRSKKSYVRQFLFFSLITIRVILGLITCGIIINLFHWVIGLFLGFVWSVYDQAQSRRLFHTIRRRLLPDSNRNDLLFIDRPLEDMERKAKNYISIWICMALLCAFVAVGANWYDLTRVSTSIGFFLITELTITTQIVLHIETLLVIRRAIEIERLFNQQK